MWSTGSSTANRWTLATLILMLYFSIMQTENKQLVRRNGEIIGHRNYHHELITNMKGNCPIEQHDSSSISEIFSGILEEYINKSNSNARRSSEELMKKQPAASQDTCSKDGKTLELAAEINSQQHQSSIPASSNSIETSASSSVSEQPLTSPSIESPIDTIPNKQTSQPQQKIMIEETPHLHQKRNYASKECGAKVLYANEEAENRGAILNDPERDDYMRNPCERAQNKFLIIELCETIQPTAFDIANLELFSSNPKEFRLSGSERYPTQDWALIGEYEAQDNREIHTFNVPAAHAAYAKFIKLELLTHYGNEHFCTLSTFRLYGITMVDEYDAEVVSSSSAEQEKKRIAAEKRTKKAQQDFLDRVMRRQTSYYCPLPSTDPLTCKRKSEASQIGHSQKQQQSKNGEQQQQRLESSVANGNGNGATNGGNGVKQLLTQKPITATKVADKANLRPLPGTSTNNKESVFMKLKTMAEKVQKLETKLSALERENVAKQQQSDPSINSMMQMVWEFGDKFGKIEKEMADLREENRELKKENGKLREELAELKEDMGEKVRSLDEKCTFCWYN